MIQIEIFQWCLVVAMAAAAILAVVAVLYVVLGLLAEIFGGGDE